MLNAIEPDSYVCPHRHLNPPKDEGFLVLQGKGAAIIFKDDGEIKEILLMDPAQKKWGVDIPAGIYHTIISLQSGTVFYEVKSGPYEPLTDKDFAPWAPRWPGSPWTPAAAGLVSMADSRRSICSSARAMAESSRWPTWTSTRASGLIRRRKK